jgi:hypothetical protein
VLRSRTSDCHNRLRGLTALAAHLLTFLLVFIMASARANEPVKPASRAEATAIIANACKIVTPNGVERLEKVRIGGIDQWVSIRGTDRRNPVLLYVYGGPGCLRRGVHHARCCAGDAQAEGRSPNELVVAWRKSRSRGCATKWCQ